MASRPQAIPRNDVDFSRFDTDNDCVRQLERLVDGAKQLGLLVARYVVLVAYGATTWRLAKSVFESPHWSSWGNLAVIPLIIGAWLGISYLAIQFIVWGEIRGE
jgi:hypothetical protein